MQILTVEHLMKSFGGICAVNDVSFTLNQGEFVGIIGPNGAGKTTLFNCLTGAVRFDSGTVNFLGKAITNKMPPHEISKLGMTRTFQIVKPFGDMTVLDNVIVGAIARTPNLKVAREEAEAALEATHFTEFRNHMANSLTVAGRKRVELARAIATRPSLLMLDEVMAGLNPTELREMLEILYGLKASGISLLIIEHLMDIIMNISDRVIVIERGAKIAEGLPKEVTSNPAVIAAYFGKEDD